MTPKPLRLRPRARRDIRAIVLDFRAEAGEPVATAFADALELAFRHVAHHPASGSPRFAHETGVPGLRAWRIRRFPHVMLYFERADSVEVVRILHGKRDIAGWLRGDEEPG